MKNLKLVPCEQNLKFEEIYLRFSSYWFQSVLIIWPFLSTLILLGVFRWQSWWGHQIQSLHALFSNSPQKWVSFIKKIQTKFEDCIQNFHTTPIISRRKKIPTTSHFPFNSDSFCHFAVFFFLFLSVFCLIPSPFCLILHDRYRRFFKHVIKLNFLPSSDEKVSKSRRKVQWAAKQNKLKKWRIVMV